MAKDGAFIFENLLAQKRQDPWLGSIEVQLFTDTWVIAEYKEPPYEFLNLVPIGPRDQLIPSMLLRVAFHWSPQLPPPSERKTDAARYHKGWLEDEVAAIASLILGIRLQCGPTTREFRPGDTDTGRPTYTDRKRKHSLPPKSELRLPARDEASLLELDRIGSLHLISAKQSIALVKAARLYQQALWLAEIDAADAWLLLVSAVETAATCWQGESKTALEELKHGDLELFNFLSSFENPQIVEGVATRLSGRSKVKVKFSNFLLTFLPPAPAKRPPEGFLIPWSSDDLSPSFAKIYDHRSRALHDGIGFPYPMTEKPQKWGREWEASTERPGGLSTSTLGATWNSTDCPMFLHIFAYIVQGALLAWWDAGLPRLGTSEGEAATT